MIKRKTTSSANDEQTRDAVAPTLSSAIPTPSADDSARSEEEEAQLVRKKRTPGDSQPLVPPSEEPPSSELPVEQVEGPSTPIVLIIDFLTLREMNSKFEALGEGPEISLEELEQVQS